MFGHLLTQEVTLESSPLTSLCELARTFAEKVVKSNNLWNTQTFNSIVPSRHILRKICILWDVEWGSGGVEIGGPIILRKDLKRLEARNQFTWNFLTPSSPQSWNQSNFVAGKLGFAKIKLNAKKASPSWIYFVVFVVDVDAYNVDVYADLDVDEWRYRFEQAG